MLSTDIFFPDSLGNSERVNKVLNSYHIYSVTRANTVVVWRLFAAKSVVKFNVEINWHSRVFFFHVFKRRLVWDDLLLGRQQEEVKPNVSFVWSRWVHSPFHGVLIFILWQPSLVILIFLVQSDLYRNSRILHEFYLLLSILTKLNLNHLSGVWAMFPPSCVVVHPKILCPAWNFIYRSKKKKKYKQTDTSVFQFSDVNLCYSSAEKNVMALQDYEFVFRISFDFSFFFLWKC